MSLLLLFNQNLHASPEAEASAQALREQVAADAVDWTGLEARAQSDTTIVERTKLAIVDLKILIEKTGLTNVEKARAIAIANGLSELIESPQPEWKAILQLFSSPSLNNVIGIANVVLFVFQLFGLTQ